MGLDLEAGEPRALGGVGPEVVAAVEIRFGGHGRAGAWGGREAGLFHEPPEAHGTAEQGGVFAGILDREQVKTSLLNEVRGGDSGGGQREFAGGMSVTQFEPRQCMAVAVQVDVKPVSVLCEDSLSCV